MLIEQLGLEGYGIFWVLIETLRDQPGYKYPLALLPALARRYNTTHDKMKVVVYNYGLFEIENDEFFFSESLRRRMEHLDYKRELARIAGKKSAEKRLMLNAGSTDVQPTFNECSTSKVKESKVKERKENNNISSKEDIVRTKRSDTCPYNEIVELFNTICKSFPKVTKLSSSRKKKINVRWREIQSLEKFKEIFEKTENTPFLKGDNNRNWKATFDWLIENDRNWVKVLEGAYDKKIYDPTDEWR